MGRRGGGREGRGGRGRGSAAVTARGKEEKTREQAAPVPNAGRQGKDNASKKRKAGGSIAEPQKPDARAMREVKLRMGLKHSSGTG
jgi:hypothetical protein